MVPRLTRLCLLFALLLLPFTFPALADAPPPGLYVSNLTPAGVLHYDGTTGAHLGAFAAGNAPAGLAFGPDGNLYIAANADNDILRYNVSAGTTSVFVPAGAGGLNGPLGLTFGADGNLYVGNGGNSSVLSFNGTTGAPLGVFVPSGGGGLNGPFSLTFGPDHNLYVASINTNSILSFNGTTGTPLGAFVPNGSGLIGPSSIIFGADGNLYVASDGTSSVLHYNGATGAPLGAFVPAGSGGLGSLFGLAFGPDGNLYVTSNATNSRVLRFNGTTGAFLNEFASAIGSDLTYLAFSPTTASPQQELITNGGFEVGGLAGWTTNDWTAETGATSGAFVAAGGTSVPDNAPPTVGPASGTTYAVSSETGPGAHALSQSFTVPGQAQSVTLSFDMFVDDYFPGGAVIDPSGLDPTSGGTSNSNQYARVDLLRNGAPIFTTAPDQAGGVGGPGVLRNFYDGADAGSNPHPYIHYSFDITPQAGVPATYTLRFANVTNRAPIHQGVDNVSVKYVPMTVAPGPLSLSLSPATLIAGASSSLTLTLSAPAQPGPDPSGGSLGAYGAIIRLTNYPTIITYPYGATSNNGYLFRGQDGYTYVLIPTGQTTTSFSVMTPNVSTSTALIFMGTYSGTSASTTLTINPVQVASLTLNPPSVTTGAGGGGTSTATLTLNAPAIPMPDPNNPGQTAPGALVQVSSDSLATYFPNGNPFVLVPQGQTSATFTIAVGSVSATMTANITAALNRSSKTAPLVITPIQVASLTLSPTSVLAGGTSTATVTLNSPAAAFSPNPVAPGSGAAGTFVRVSSDSPVASFPSTPHDAAGNTYVFVPQGLTSATFTVGTGAVAASTTANITAAIDSSAQTVPLIVTPIQVALLTLNPTSITSGGTSTATVTLNSPASPSPNLFVPGRSAAGTFVQVSSDNTAAGFPGLTSAPDGNTYVFIPLGQTSTTFTVGVGNVPASATANVTAALNGSSQSAPLAITPIQVASLTLIPTSVTSGGTSSAILTLNAPALPMPDPNNPGQTAPGAVVQVSSDSPLASFPNAVQGPSGSFVLIPQGQTNATFTIGTGYAAANATADISAALNGSSQSAALAITPIQVISLALSPASVASGGISTATVTLNNPAITSPNPLAPGSAAPGVYVQVSSDNAAAFIPAAQAPDGKNYVLVPPGQTSATFTIGTGAVAASTTANITASLNGSSQAAPLTITPAGLSGVSVSPNPVVGGQAATGTVSYGGPVAADTIVILATSSAASVPPSVIVRSGQSSATFPVTTRAAAARCLRPRSPPPAAALRRLQP